MDRPSPDRYFYFINFPQDRRLIKITVLTLLVFEIGAT